MIDLKFFGRGAGFFPAFGNTNAWLVRENHLLMLDCGESTFEEAIKNPGLNGWDDVTVLLTHLHSDHSGSLGTFLAYNYFVLNRKVKLVHPVTTVNNLLRLQGIGEEVYTYYHSMPPIGDLQAKAIPVHHAPDMACFAYELKDNDECIYYSGDAAEFPDTVAKKLENNQYARVYQDISSNPASVHHCPVSFIEAKVPRELRSRVYGMHLDSAGFEAILRERGFSVVESQRR